MIRITTAREPVSSLVYHVCGAGPDVLLLHGWLGSGRMWHGVMRALSPYFRCWAPDLPGFGASPLPEDAEPSSLADYQHSVRTFCDALSVRPYALVGHSMGALLALSLAVEHPELMDRLVLLSPPVRGRIGLRLDVPLRTMWGRRVFQRLRPAWRTLTRVGMPTVFAPTPEDLPVKMEAARRKVEDARRASWRATIGGAQMVVENNYADRLDEISCPVLVVVGEWDLTIPPEEGMFAARMMPHARLLHLPRVAHQVTDDAPLDVQRALLDFLLALDEDVYDGG